MKKRRCSYLTPCLVLLAMLCGCGGGGEEIESAQTIEVGGTLTIDGKPYGPALLSFTHASNEDAPEISAQVKEDGTFELLSYKAEGSAPQGTYDVVIDEDPEAMSAEGVPVVKPLSVEISAAGEETLKLQIEATSTGGAMRTGGALP